MRYFIVTLFLLGVVVLGVGFFQNWFQIRTGMDQADSRTILDLELTWDQEKMSNDLRQARNKAEEMALKGKEDLKAIGRRLKGLKTVEGRIQNVQRENGKVVIETLDNQEKVIRLDEARTLEKLSEGNQVKVVYREEDGTITAQRVEVVE